MSNYEIVYNEDYLKHHGILGQKWGKKNGPPYPLDQAAKSSSEKNPTKKSSNSSVSKSSPSVKSRLNEEQKEKIKKTVMIGAAAAGVALVAIGGVRLAKSGQLTKAIATGKKFTEKAGVIAKKEAKDWKNIAKESIKSSYKGIKEGAPEGAHNTGKKIGSVMSGGILWLAGMEVADLATNGAATKVVMEAYNNHQKKENRVSVNYRKKKDDD